jgi:DNA-binding MarR family transcriptional regulator
VSSNARPYTQSLLLAAYRETANELIHALHEAGHEQLRHKHGAVFANLDPQGTRPSVLAERAGMTRGAMGELVDELERLGYVHRAPDPADRRAKLIVATDAAHHVTAVVVRVNEAIERRYRRELGTDDYQTLRTALERLAGDHALVQPRIRA